MLLLIKAEYTVGKVHINSIQGYWRILKRGIYGIYHQVSPKQLPRYSNEFSGKFKYKGYD
jgi:hypothetical protein